MKKGHAGVRMAVVCLALAACGEATEEMPQSVEAAEAGAAVAVPTEPSLDDIRLATERFQDVDVALAEGYVRDPMNVCETAEIAGRPASEGAMGVHYVRMDLLGIAETPAPRVNGTGTHLDFTTPAVLLYEPQADGSMQLVAVENLVFKAAWDAAGNTEAPAYQGQGYEYREDDPNTPIDEAHMFEPHYERHVWLYRDNPSGTFAQFNPMVTCEHHTASMETMGQ